MACVYFPGAILLGTDLISRLGKLSTDFNEGTIEIRGCKYQKLNEDTNTTLAATVSKPQSEIHENLATVLSVKFKAYTTPFQQKTPVKPHTIQKTSVKHQDCAYVPFLPALTSLFKHSHLSVLQT